MCQETTGSTALNSGMLIMEYLPACPTGVGEDQGSMATGDRSLHGIEDSGSGVLV